MRISIFLLVLVVWSCSGSEMKEIEFFERQDKLPLEVSKEVEILYTDSAILKARLQAPVMQTYQEEKNNKYTYMVMPEGVKARFYNRYGEANSSIRSNYAERHPIRNETELEGDVVVVNVKGDSLKTEKLIWDEKEDQIHSDEFVRVKTDKQVIFAEGFESNTEFTDYTFYNIKGTIAIDTSEQE